jgi:hypothetical protein
MAIYLLQDRECIHAFIHGRDLHQVAVLKDFCGVYGPIYAKVFAKYVS